MKKIVEIITVAFISIAFSACGGGGSDTSSLGGLTSMSSGGDTMGSAGSMTSGGSSMMGGGSMSLGSMGSMMGPAGAMMGGGGGGGGGTPPEAPKYRYLGDVNVTMGDQFIPLSAAYEVNHEIFNPNWTRDPNQDIIVTVAGYEIDFDHDRLNPNVKPIIIKFNMGSEFTTGQFPIIYPPNLQQAGVQIGFLQPMQLWPGAFVMGGGGGGMWIDENNQTKQFQVIFGIAVPHAD